MTDTRPACPSPVRIVPREGHGISRKDISPNALRVLYRLREGGFAAYLVGGAVRDLLIGGHPKDFDVATDATPEQVKSLFRNCRLIGRRFRLAHVIYGREIIEVATFRANEDDGSGSREMGDEGRIHRDNVYGTIEDDAVRRDFSANALYYAIEDFSVRDYVGGFEDVQARVLRLIGDPESRYREDPVRMLRAVRLSSKLDFSIDPAAAEPLPRLAPLLSGAAPARLFDECLKMFMAGHGERSFLALEQHGLLPALFGETAKALATNRSGALRGTLLGALRSTDARVQADRPVTPAFLFAALLWPAYCRELAVLQKSGVETLAAQQRAADRVTLHQAERIALPRRFSLPMQEIWLLQPRFQQRQRRVRFPRAARGHHARTGRGPGVLARGPGDLARVAGRFARVPPRPRRRSQPRRRRRAVGCRPRPPSSPSPPVRRGSRHATCRSNRLMPDPVRAYVALGANLGEVETTLAEAIWALDGLPQTSVRRQSPWFRSPPWGRSDQPEFTNGVAELQTRLVASELMQRLLEIEERFGRVRHADDRWGPRTLDLDLLVYGEQTIDDPGLQVPHPALHERPFVLLPLSRIAPTLDIPGRGRVDELLAQVDCTGLRELD